MGNVFISYAKEDAAAAKLLADALQKSGFEVWWDRRIRPGETWDAVIGRALDSAVCVIVLWSANSIQSRWVREEAERASSRGCLVPVLVEKVDPPLGFGRIQAADLSTWRGDPDDPKFADLLAGVSELAATTAAQPRPATPPARPSNSAPVRPRIWSRSTWIATGVIAFAVALYFVSRSLHPPKPETANPETTKTEPSKPETPSSESSAAVPNVVGLRSHEARRVLLSLGFARIVEDRMPSSRYEPGVVAEQDPVAGTHVPKDGSVRIALAVSPSPQPSPSPPPGAPPRLPAPQQIAPPRGAILAAFPPSVTMVWKPVPGARTYSVEHAILQPGEDCRSLSRGSRTFSGIEESSYTLRLAKPVPGCWRVWAVGANREEGLKSAWSRLDFESASGTLPNVVGLPLSDARQRLLSSGFTKIGRRPKATGDLAPGTVLEQNPAPGTSAPPDTHVWLTVATAPAPSVPSRQYEGVWRNVSPDLRFIQFIEIAPAAQNQVTIRAWLRCHPTPAEGGTIDNCQQWHPVRADVEASQVHWIYPGDNVGDNLVTISGRRLVVRTTKTNWTNFFERTNPNTIPGWR